MVKEAFMNTKLLFIFLFLTFSFFIFPNELAVNNTTSAQSKSAFNFNKSAGSSIIISNYITNKSDKLSTSIDPSVREKIQPYALTKGGSIAMIVVGAILTAAGGVNLLTGALCMALWAVLRNETNSTGYTYYTYTYYTYPVYSYTSNYQILMIGGIAGLAAGVILLAIGLPLLIVGAASYKKLKQGVSLYLEGTQQSTKIGLQYRF
jgi:hypothetical protein